MRIDSRPSILKAKRLDTLLEKVKYFLLKNGVKSTSQRGTTYSLNKILLVWEEPFHSTDKSRYSFRSKEEDTWYQKIFVEKSKNNLPEKIAKKGELIFPYKYAQRSRFYDTGWGYGLATILASKEIGIKPDAAFRDIESFSSWLIEMGEYVHVQTVLEVLSMWGRRGFTYWSKNPDLLNQTIKGLRIDVLDRITKEIISSPETRRAITPSNMYPGDYLLDPMMGVPPYQNFQLLPGDRRDKLSSLHWHRSLDASGGAQLDFNHDFSWLKYASLKSKRKMGSIAILAGNLHLYVPEETNNIKDWLKRVTDGYQSGNGTPRDLIGKEAYLRNIKRVYHLLK